jgi:hypothetical protein
MTEFGAAGVRAFYLLLPKRISVSACSRFLCTITGTLVLVEVLTARCLLSLPVARLTRTERGARQATSTGKDRRVG